MFEHIKAKLKNNGYIPDTIIDIGACYGVFTDKMLDIFPESKYYLFESNNHPELQKFLVKDNVKVFNTKLGPISEIARETINVQDFLYLKDMKNVFIKINCKNEVIPILKGANDFLKITDFILIDLPVDDKYDNSSQIFFNNQKFLSDKGFILIDDIHNYKDGELKRYNILFVNKNYKN